MRTIRTFLEIRRLGPAVAGLAILGLILAGCNEQGSSPEVDEAELEEAVRAYLPRLATAYATGNLEPLKELAVEKEVAHVRQRVSELSDQGKIYEPELKELTVEDIAVWQYANAFVTTVEVWDVRSYAMGSRTLLSETLDQRNQVKYQLKRKDDGWKILYRELMDAPGE